MTAPARDIVRKNRVLVGRDRVLDAMTSRICRAAAVDVYDVTGGGGMGKTTFLAHACERLARRRGHQVVAAFATFENVDPRPSSKDPLALKAERLSAHLSLLQTLGDQLPAEHADAFATDVPEILRSLGGKLDESHILIDRAADMAGRTLARRIEATAAEPMDGAAGPRRIAIFLDESHRVDRDVLGTWVAAFIGRLAGARGAVVLGRVGSRPPATALPYPDRTFPITPLRSSDVAAYLERVVGWRPPRPAMARIVQWSGGHPLALRTFAKHAERLRPTRPDVGIGIEACELSDELRQEVEHLLDSLADPALRAAAEVAALARSFDTSFLRSLLSDLRLDAAAAAEQLESHALVTRSGERYEILPFLRKPLERSLTNRSGRTRDYSDRDAFSEIHDLARRYYEMQLHGVIEDRVGYHSWERLENEQTQSRLREYVFHASKLARPYARQSLARVYFDAFWWWGCYETFPLCSDLLEVWTAESTTDDFLQALQTFNSCYPPGYKKTSADWPSVAVALEAIQAGAGVLGDPQTLGFKGRHVRAITDVFLAQALFFQDPLDRRVDERLEEAADLFQPPRYVASREADEDDDSWCVAWVRFHQSDIALARGGRSRHALDTAETLARDALRLAEVEQDDEKRDFEVMANAHRVLADVAWARARTDEALDSLAEAVYHAYAFQGVPKPPDVYTRAFFREMMERTVERLKELAEADATRAAAACDRLWDFWLPYWKDLEVTDDRPNFAALVERRVWDDIAVCVAPVEPQREDMAPRTAYVSRVRKVYSATAARRRAARRTAPAPPRAGHATPRAGHATPRARSLPALAAPVIPSDRLEPNDHPVWKRAWKTPYPEAWPDIAGNDERLSEVRTELQKAIADLPPARQDVLRLRDIKGQSADDVARDTGISVADQTVMLHRARASVQDALERYFATTSS